MITNIVQRQINLNDIGHKLKTAPVRKAKNENTAILAQTLLINDAAMDDSDKELLKILHAHLVDMIENTYNPLCEELYEQMTPSQALIMENDVFHFFKLQSFVLEFCRMRASKEFTSNQR